MGSFCVDSAVFISRRLIGQRYFLLILFLFLLSLSALSQTYHFRNFGIADGLISNNVESVIQDSLGFIWVSSESGLSRYEGSSFSHYYSEVGDSTSLMNKSVDNMHVDRKGRLWLGMRQGGIARYRYDSDDFKNYSLAKTDTGQTPIASTYYFSSGEEESLIIRTVDAKTFRYDESKDIFESYSPWDNIQRDESNTPIPVFFDSRSRFWLAIKDNGTSGILPVEKGEKSSEQELVPIRGHVNCVFEAPVGVLWIGTWGSGLYRHDMASNSTKRYLPSENATSLPGSVVEDLEIDEAGNLWIATENGIALVRNEILLKKGDDISFIRPVHSATARELGGHFKEIECDTGGRLWLTSYGGGLFLHDPQSMPYTVVAMQNAGEDDPMLIKTVFEIEDSEGRQWYAQEDSVVRYNPISGEFLFIDLENNEKSEGGFKAIVNLTWTADGRVMVHYQGGTFVLIDSESLKQEYFPNGMTMNVPRGVLRTFRDSHGAFWVTTYKGVLRHPGSDLAVFDTIVPEFDGRDILEDKEGMIWIGSWNQGVIRVDPTTLEFERFDPNLSEETGLLGTDAHHLQMSADGRVWTLTSKGLNFFNRETGRFEFIDPSANNELQLTDFFAVDKNGNVWFSSLKGLFHWKQKTKKVMFLDQNYGLPQTEYFEIKAAKDSAVYVSTGMGCLSFNPNLVPDPHIPGEVLFISMRYENEEGNGQKSLLNNPHFEISYRENFVEVNFTSFNYGLTGEVRYEYMLVGGSNRWFDLNDETKVSFLDLPHGAYELKVRPRNDWDECGPVSRISFSVSPPWWYSKIMIAGYVLLLVIAIVLYNRFRTNKLRRRQKQLEFIVDERTEEISMERDRSESLLLNILPAEVVEELKHKGQAEAKKIDHVTVLFTDFKGFTQYSEKVSPEALVEDLHESFTAFDEIMVRHGVEKIKTIGDAYMAAGGLPTPNETHARDVLAAAFEIRDFIEAGKAKKIKNDLPYFELRIGIHTGPVVAGIVGVKKFSYDIWGDTVNTASRMESSGLEGKVNISQTTYELVKEMNDYTFESRGKIKAKGKGEMEMFFVEKRYSI